MLVPTKITGYIAEMTTVFRYSLAAFGHAVFWIVFLQLCFSVVEIDIIAPAQFDWAGGLAAFGLIGAGIAVLAAITYFARRLPGRKA
jgi:hypothetical protein